MKEEPEKLPSGAKALVDFAAVTARLNSLIGNALERIGVAIVFSWPATVIAATVAAFPPMYRTSLGAFEQVNPNLLDAAHNAGRIGGEDFQQSAAAHGSAPRANYLICRPTCQAICDERSAWSPYLGASLSIRNGTCCCKDSHAPWRWN